MLLGYADDATDLTNGAVQCHHHQHRASHDNPERSFLIDEEMDDELKRTEGVGTNIDYVVLSEGESNL